MGALDVYAIVRRASLLTTDDPACQHGMNPTREDQTQ